MPRIKRYHPVSHEFNRDPEVQDLRRQSADWMGYVWLEMLAIADKNNGHIKGTISELARGLAWLSLSDRPSFGRGKIEVGIRFMLEKGWIKDVTGSYLVCKYPDYHKTREQTKSHEGTKEVPSFLPSEPSELPKQTQKVPSADPAQPAGSAPPTPDNGFDPDTRTWLLATKHLKPLAEDKHADFWSLLVEAYDRYPWLYFEEQIKKADAWMESNPSRAPTPRGLRRFMRSWMEKAVEIGRKQHG